jgi:transposase-like protein
MNRYATTQVIKVYSEEFKRQVVEEYLAGGIGFRAILRKYEIPGKSTLPRWIKKLGYCDPRSLTPHTFAPVIIAPLAKKNTSTDQSDLAKRCQELERQLQDEKLRSEAYARIIEKAEKELKISIRKKLSSR